jgi:hypothetical protein
VHLIARSIARCQRGFTTVTLMGVLSVGTLLVAGGMAAVGPDISISREDQDYKQAYAAAEAGVQWYLSAMAKDNDYYVSCDADLPDPSPGQPAPVNDAWDGTGSDPRTWRTLVGSEARYTVELLPAPGYAECVPGDQYSMVDSNGNMRLRVSGNSREQTRTLLVTLRRRNFLDFIYFTNFETLDPLAYSSSGKRNWASTHCNQFRSEREDEWSGTYGSCSEIQFVADDELLGPVHSNDSLLICGSATFGRNERDSIELNEQAPGYVGPSGCDPEPEFGGTVIYPSGQLGMPPSNLGIADLAAAGYAFSGRTKIHLQGTSMTVTKSDGTIETKPLPTNGVVYVGPGGSCGVGYSRAQTYSSPAACGDAWVKGEYSSDLTIAADNDVIIEDELTRSEPGLLLGLIANNFVRVYHRVTDPSAEDCANLPYPDSLENPLIQAAILALNHSFIVDNWFCGDGLGDLTVEGAIAQQYRGTVGTTGGTGYLKDYQYNDRLRYREPPYFLDPVQSSWRVARQTELVPAVE